MPKSDRSRVGFALTAIAAVFAGGTVGFHLLIDEPWLESFYRTVVSMSLTGLDTVPTSDGAQILTIFLVLAGVTIFGYLVTQIVTSIAREVTGDARREKRRRRMIEEIHDHFIICGYGRVGRRAAEEFQASGEAFVVLDTSHDAIDVARDRGILFVEGSGSEDAHLDRAGIERARGLIASADSDAENLYITLSARSRRADLMIVARASNREAERKLALAGANRIVQPYSTAGTEMAKLALKPQVAAFIELVSTHAGPDLRFEEIEVQPGWPQAGRSIRDLRIRATTGAVVIALRRPDGSFDVTPDPDVTIGVGDVMIVIGKEPELQALEELFSAEHGAP